MSTMSAAARLAWRTRKLNKLSLRRRVTLLMKEKRRWERRQTIVQNKLRWIDRSVERLLMELITPPKPKATDNPHQRKFAV